jgi:hypothetical protein
LHGAKGAIAAAAWIVWPHREAGLPAQIAILMPPSATSVWPVMNAQASLDTALLIRISRWPCCAVLRRDRVDGGIGIGTRADVERGDAGLPAGTGDLLLARLQALEIPAIENHMGAGQRQTRRHAGTQAARGTGDQGDTALQ